MNLCRLLPNIVLISSSALGLFVTNVRAESIEIRPEIQKLEKAVESKVQEKIIAILGEDTKAVVTLHITESKNNRETATKSQTDFGYVPLPVDVNNLGEEQQISPPVFIESVEADLQVPTEMDETTVKSIKELVTRTLKGLNPNVTVKKYVVSTPVVKKRELTLEQGLVILAIIIVTLILLLSVFVVSGAFKSSARFVADGLREFSNGAKVTVKNEATKISPIDLNVSDKKAEKGEPAVLNTTPEYRAAMSQAFQDYEKNFELFRQILKDSPAVLAQTAEDNDREWIGLRRLLAKLDNTEQENVLKALGDERLQRMKEVPTESATATFNHPLWLQGFVERLILKKVQGGSQIEKALGINRTLHFRKAKPLSLITAVTKVNKKGAWRLLPEFLPADQMEEFLSKLEPEKWGNVLTASDVTDDELRGNADELIKELGNSLKEQSNEKRNEYYSSTLLAPVLNLLKNKTPGEDDQFLDVMANDAPGLADLVLENMWTSRCLDKVPDTFLKGIIENLEANKLTALILGFPQAQSERIAAMLPNNMTKEIVLDEVKHARAKNDTEAFRAAKVVSKQFLDYLRRQSEEGTFAIEKEQIQKAA